MRSSLKIFASLLMCAALSACDYDGKYEAQQVAFPVKSAVATLDGPNFTLVVKYANAQDRKLYGNVSESSTQSFTLKPEEGQASMELNFTYSIAERVWHCDNCTEWPAFKDIGRRWKKLD